MSNISLRAFVTAGDNLLIRRFWLFRSSYATLARRVYRLYIGFLVLPSRYKGFVRSRSLFFELPLTTFMEWTGVLTLLILNPTPHGCVFSSPADSNSQSIIIRLLLRFLNTYLAPTLVKIRITPVIKDLWGMIWLFIRYKSGIRRIQSGFLSLLMCETTLMNVLSSVHRF